VGPVSQGHGAMAFVLLGCLLVLAKFAGLGPVENLSWWWILSPFAAAAVWWLIADATGATKRRAMERERKRVEDRRERHLKAMGLDTTARRRPRPPVDGPSP